MIIKKRQNLCLLFTLLWTTSTKCCWKFGSKCNCQYTRWLPEIRKFQDYLKNFLIFQLVLNSKKIKTTQSKSFFVTNCTDFCYPDLFFAAHHCQTKFALWSCPQKVSRAWACEKTKTEPCQKIDRLSTP